MANPQANQPLSQGNAMTGRDLKNHGASIRQRLLNYAGKHDDIRFGNRVYPGNNCPYKNSKTMGKPF